jgi:hypothetical protein
MRWTTEAIERSSSMVTRSKSFLSLSVTKVTMRCGRARFLAVFGLPRFGPLLEVGLFIVFLSQKSNNWYLA